MAMLGVAGCLDEKACDCPIDLDCDGAVSTDEVIAIWRGDVTPDRLLTLLLDAEALATCSQAAGIDLSQPIDAFLPSQEAFPSLDALHGKDAPVVRIYATPLIETAGLAVHTWVAYRAAPDADWRRWEVSRSRRGPLRNVWSDQQASDDALFGLRWVLAEFRGDEAWRIIDALENLAPQYPCWERYVVFPGPNSNTFVAWILEQAQIDFVLPPHAIGALHPPVCERAGVAECGRIAMADTPTAGVVWQAALCLDELTSSHCFELDVSPGQGYRVETAGDTDTFIAAFDKEGRLRLANDDLEDHNASIVWVAKHAETLTLRFDGYAAETRGCFEARLVLLADDDPARPSPIDRER